MAKLPKKKTVINKNDKLARDINRLIHKNKCARCRRDGEHFQLDWSHVYGRSSKKLRWDEQNALLLCRNCHFNWWHEKPLEAAEWFEKQYPGRKSQLQKKLNTTHSMSIHDYLKIQEQLKERLLTLQTSHQKNKKP